MVRSLRAVSALGISLSLFTLVSSTCAVAQETVESLGSAVPQVSREKGKAFNPDIGMNFLMFYLRNLGNYGNQDRFSQFHNGFNFQEAEIQLSADVDPYLRAVGNFSLGQKLNKADTDPSKRVDGVEFEFEPEELYIETLSLPYVTVRAGKFYASFGRHNTLHTHAFPFIDAPMINTDLLGDEGLNSLGVSAAALVPSPWFTELTLQVFANDNDVLFASPRSSDGAGLAYLKNLWDLTDDLTLEWGFYGTIGANRYDATTTAYGSDLIFKWRPSEGGKYHALIWQSEYLNGQIKGSPTQARLGGLASWLQYQFAERWWVQGRVEQEGLPRSEVGTIKRKQSALVGFFPSEFSGFRLQYDRINTQGVTAVEHRMEFQWNISIGAHPAHAY